MSTFFCTRGMFMHEYLFWPTLVMDIIWEPAGVLQGSPICPLIALCCYVHGITYIILWNSWSGCRYCKYWWLYWPLVSVMIAPPFEARSCWNNEVFEFEVQHINGLVQERRNSIANALELHLSCTNPSIQSVFNINMFYNKRKSHSSDGYKISISLHWEFLY